MRGFDKRDVKQWARTIKDMKQVDEVRAIVCEQCKHFVKSTEGNRLHTYCNYNLETGNIRTWSIFACVDRGGFAPKENVDTDTVRGKLNEWIRKHAPSVGKMQVRHVGRTDGGVCKAGVQSGHAHDQRDSGSVKKGMQEVRKA